MDLEEFKRTQWMTEEEYNDYAYVLAEEQIKKTINDVLKDYDNKLRERIYKAIKFIDQELNEINHKQYAIGSRRLNKIRKILKGEE